MKIDRVATVGTPATRRSGRGRKGTDFSKALDSVGEAAPGASVSGGAAVGPVDSLLALQEVAGDAAGREQGRRRAELLLERLDELHLGLLDGRLSPATVERLAAVVAARRAQVDDPRLARVLDEIEVRAAVELAKLGQ